MYADSHIALKSVLVSILKHRDNLLINCQKRISLDHIAYVRIKENRIQTMVMFRITQLLSLTGVLIHMYIILFNPHNIASVNS